MSKARVRIKEAIPERSDRHFTGEEGYVDGYLLGARGIPSAAVVIKDRIAVVPVSRLEVLPEKSLLKQLEQHEDITVIEEEE